MSVDFVEFVDGTTWGPDTTNAAERLDAHFAGRRAERDHLLKLLGEGGTPAVITAIEPDEVQIVLPPGFPERWEQSYRTASSDLSERSKTAKMQLIAELFFRERS